MSEPTVTTDLEREVILLRAALQDIAEVGRALSAALPLAPAVPGSLAQGAILTLTGLAEAGLASVGTS